MIIDPFKYLPLDATLFYYNGQYIQQCLCEEDKDIIKSYQIFIEYYMNNEYEYLFIKNSEDLRNNGPWLDNQIKNVIYINSVRLHIYKKTLLLRELYIAMLNTEEFMFFHCDDYWEYSNYFENLLDGFDDFALGDILKWIGLIDLTEKQKTIQKANENYK